jgi:hypothetical protein
VQFENLKELELIGNREYYFRVEELQVAQFKLELLLILCCYEEEFELKPQTRKNFEKFVLSMAGTLTTMKFDGCNSKDLHLVLTKLPALKRFTVTSVPDVDRKMAKGELIGCFGLTENFK